MSNRAYNHLYMVGRVVIQVSQYNFYDGFKIELFPQIVIAVNNRLVHFGIAFEWITGTVCFGWARNSFVESEKVRQQRVQEAAEKLGITNRQQELRWGW